MSRKLAPDEKSLWRMIARQIAPLHPAPEPDEDRAVHVKKEMPVAQKKPFFLPPVKPAGERKIVAQDVDARTLGRFRRGQMPIEATLDLHGHRVHEARFALLDFLRQAHVRQARCILVIHGKGSITGEAKIKKSLPHWLEEIPDIILAHAPAKMQHGGLGASYILLRRKRMT